MTRRPDVYRTTFPTQAVANPRSLGAAIFCDIGSSGLTEPDDVERVLLCSIEIDSLDDYQRVFASATVGGIAPFSPTQAEAQANVWIDVDGASQSIVPSVYVREIAGHASITGAIDLPRGSYTFGLYIANGSFEEGSYIQWSTNSLQIITAQVVSAQECWVGGGES